MTAPETATDARELSSRRLRPETSANNMSLWLSSTGRPGLCPASRHHLYDMSTQGAKGAQPADPSPLVLITGGGRGIGRATAYALAEMACSLILTYNQDKASAEETRDKCRELGAP